jgi:hypothetical protein
MVLGVYLSLCVLVGWFGSRRLFGFWGNSILAFFASPLLVGIVLLVGSARPKAPLPPLKPSSR